MIKHRFRRRIGLARLVYATCVAWSAGDAVVINAQTKARRLIDNPVIDGRYDTTTNPALNDVRQLMYDHVVFFGPAFTFNRDLRLPKQVTIVGRECGEATATYSRRERRVTMCYELARSVYDYFARLYKGQPDSSTQASELAGQALTFIVWHELGHAVVHLLELPVLGREEDAADQFAVFMLSVHDERDILISGRVILGAFAKREHYDLDAMADVHALNIQRLFNVGCWDYGWSPSSLSANFLVEIPHERLVGCAEEFTTMRRNWARALQPYVLHHRR